MSSAFLLHPYGSHSASYAVVVRSFTARLAYSGYREAGQYHPFLCCGLAYVELCVYFPIYSLTVTDLPYTKCLFTRCGEIEKHYALLFIWPILFMQRFIDVYSGSVRTYVQIYIYIYIYTHTHTHTHTPTHGLPLDLCKGLTEISQGIVQWLACSDNKYWL